jgi:hypothetical protein
VRVWRGVHHRAIIEMSQVVCLQMVQLADERPARRTARLGRDLFRVVMLKELQFSSSDQTFLWESVGISPLGRHDMSRC